LAETEATLLVCGVIGKVAQMLRNSSAARTLKVLPVEWLSPPPCSSRGPQLHGDNLDGGFRFSRSFLRSVSHVIITAVRNAFAACMPSR
jgi:hypothetical protein